MKNFILELSIVLNSLGPRTLGDRGRWSPETKASLVYTVVLGYLWWCSENLPRDKTKAASGRKGLSGSQFQVPVHHCGETKAAGALKQLVASYLVKSREK